MKKFSDGLRMSVSYVFFLLFVFDLFSLFFFLFV